MRLMFFLKMFEISCRFHKCEKNWEYILGLKIISLELAAINPHFYRHRIFVIGIQYVTKQSQSHFRYYYDRIFQNEVLSEWSKNMTQILPCRFQQCFGPSNMLIVHNISDTGLFRYLSNHAFCSLSFRKSISYEAHLLFQSVQNFI